LSQLLQYKNNTFAGFDLIYKHKCRYLEHFDVIPAFFFNVGDGRIWQNFLENRLAAFAIFGYRFVFPQGSFLCVNGEPEYIINLCKGVLLCFY